MTFIIHNLSPHERRTVVVRTTQVPVVAVVPVRRWWGWGWGWGR